jgi:hypothetical protein
VQCELNFQAAQILIKNTQVTPPPSTSENHNNWYLNIAGVFQVPLILYNQTW